MEPNVLSVLCTSTKHGVFVVEKAVATDLAGLVKEYGEAAVYHAATAGHSLADTIHNFVKGKLRGSDVDPTLVVQEAVELGLTAPKTKDQEKAKKAVNTLATVDPKDVKAALSGLNEAQRAALKAAL